MEKKDAEFAFQRVGVRAGTVKTDFSHVSPSSHYFLRPSPGGPLDLKSRINTLDFSEIRLRTAGNPSIAKSELIKEYDRIWGNITTS